jgi:hypothetical protein
MVVEKKPDNVVFNYDTQKYDASLRPYGTSVGAPIITTTDTIAWKNRNINKVNHKIQTKYLELKAEYEDMILLYENNKLIFEAKFTFEPIIGKVYHLYKRTDTETFLSIISPDECNFDSLGSFYLNSDQVWRKL